MKVFNQWWMLLVERYEVLVHLNWFKRFGKERRKGEIVNVFVSKWFYGPNI